MKIGGNDPDGDLELINLLVYTMGPKAENIMLGFNLTDQQVKDHTVVYKCFDDYYLPKRNIIYERTQFNLRIQLPQET